MCTYEINVLNRVVNSLLVLKIPCGSHFPVYERAYLYFQLVVFTIKFYTHAIDMEDERENTMNEKIRSYKNRGRYFKLIEIVPLRRILKILQNNADSEYSKDL